VNNSGDISAGSGLAIDTAGASTSINNSGLITGFIDLTNRGDTLTNMAGGEFNASGTRRFRRGNDLFLNEAGAMLRTATKFSTNEDTRFTGLERFENKGLITMVDGKTGDSLTMSNRPRGTDLNFRGSGRSTLGVDTFLGGPGSKSDTLTVEGTPTGRTRLSGNNVNPGPGVLNRQGIPVVYVDGNVNARKFYLQKPIDTDFFDYDLVFVPTGSGRFDLRSHPGGGAHILPHTITATHETFHQSTETWFDQIVDLRAMLARGSLCDDIKHPQERIRCQDLYDIVPAVWARCGGTWLDLDDNGTTKANGRTYCYDLGRDLDIWQIEFGVDFGKENVLSPDDVLVFGVLGGAVESALEHDAIARSFEISSLEAGSYVTYLRGGFYLDTLFKAFFRTVEPTAAVEYPETLDKQTYGLRMDSGYRFGGLKDGPFIEPLGTVAISWTHVDDFSHQGNNIDLDDDEQVRGRVGLRMGTSAQIWEGTTFEPFVTEACGACSPENTARN
jgi:autotransporter family porin